MGKIHTDCCSDTIVCQFKNATVGAPNPILKNSRFCGVCDEIWSEYDDHGFYKLDFDSIPNAVQFYTTAKTGVLWLEASVYGEHGRILPDKIQVVKDSFDGTEMELEHDWPHTNFQIMETETDILIKSGCYIVTGQVENPYHRDDWEHSHLAGRVSI